VVATPATEESRESTPQIQRENLSEEDLRLERRKKAQDFLHRMRQSKEGTPQTDQSPPVSIPSSPSIAKRPPDQLNEKSTTEDVASESDVRDTLVLPEDKGEQLEKPLEPATPENPEPEPVTSKNPDPEPADNMEVGAEDGELIAADDDHVSSKPVSMDLTDTTAELLAAPEAGERKEEKGAGEISKPEIKISSRSPSRSRSTSTSTASSRSRSRSKTPPSRQREKDSRKGESHRRAKKRSRSRSHSRFRPRSRDRRRGRDRSVERSERKWRKRARSPSPEKSSAQRPVTRSPPRSSVQPAASTTPTGSAQPKVGVKVFLFSFPLFSLLCGFHSLLDTNLCLFTLGSARAEIESHCLLLRDAASNQLLT